VIRDLGRSVRAIVVLSVLCGLAYPLAITAVAQLTMRSRADGSLVTADGHVVGSSMIGQAWTGDAWFHGRPSAVDDDASTSSASNLGPNSRALADEIRQRATAILRVEGAYTPGLTVGDIPVDLLTASASGLDPDITVAAARFQAPRIAAVHGMTLAAANALIDAHTQGRALGVFGEPRVNVLALNLALSDRSAS
jgi:K+-transporting ATPase ATPase C chain